MAKSETDYSRPVANYGPYGSAGKDAATIKKVWEDWGVTDAWLINGTGPGRVPPLITREGGPAYMARFPDGRWHYVSFCGINGPPWTYRSDNAYSAPNGEVAYLIDRCRLLEAQHQSARLNVEEIGRRLEEAGALLEAARARAAAGGKDVRHQEAAGEVRQPGEEGQGPGPGGP